MLLVVVSTFLTATKSRMHVNVTTVNVMTDNLPGHGDRHDEQRNNVIVTVTTDEQRHIQQNDDRHSKTSDEYIASFGVSIVILLNVALFISLDGHRDLVTRFVHTVTVTWSRCPSSRSP